MYHSFQADLYAYHKWQNMQGEDNRAEFERLKKILPVAIQQCMTEKQREYFLCYFVEGLNFNAISERYGVDRSTISRTLRRGMNNLYKCLRYSVPGLEATAIEIRNVRNNQRTANNRQGKRNRPKQPNRNGPVIIIDE